MSTLQCLSSCQPWSVWKLWRECVSVSQVQVSTQVLKLFCKIFLISFFHPGWFLLRSINYDEKDPFLCNACGFCKYARFDFMLYAKPCCAVDPIENEEDRKKVIVCMLKVINYFLWKLNRRNGFSWKTFGSLFFLFCSTWPVLCLCRPWLTSTPCWTKLTESTTNWWDTDHN